mgnify:FL=1
MDKIIIGITQGDINGIGYEVILKSLSDAAIFDLLTPVIYGSSKIAAYHRKVLNIQNLSFNNINSVEEANPKRINIINCTSDEVKVELGQPTAESGKAALDALERACSDLGKGLIHALVTAPINKKNIQSEKFHFPGHTEYLAEKFSKNKAPLMMLINDFMRIAVVTGHIPLQKVASTLTTELILEKIETLNDSLKEDFLIVRPRIAVLGLNPHAGDEGVIGNEEEQVIIPALKAASEKGIICLGPYPADGFFGSGNFSNFDGVLAMYHDQGLIPFKTLSMESGVNFTAGLSIVRTSPAHGTAYDIAGKNLASENSFREALYMACDIYKNRKWNKEIRSNPLKVTPKSENETNIQVE